MKPLLQVAFLALHLPVLFLVVFLHVHVHVHVNIGIAGIILRPARMREKKRQARQVMSADI